jgi:hypothetical protein
MKLRPKSCRSSCVKSPLLIYRFSIVCENIGRDAGGILNVEAAMESMEVLGMDTRRNKEIRQLGHARLW